MLLQQLVQIFAHQFRNALAGALFDLLHQLESLLVPGCIRMRATEFIVQVVVFGQVSHLAGRPVLVPLYSATRTTNLTIHFFNRTRVSKEQVIMSG